MSILHSVVSAFTSRNSEQRQCPHCRATQKVAAALKHDSVPCAVCGQPIPPRR